MDRVRMRFPLFSRLFPRQPKAAPETPPPGGAAEVRPEPNPIDASTVGLIDMRLNGWFNDAAQELAPGFHISPDDVVIDVGAGDGGMALFCARVARETILSDRDHDRLRRSVDWLKSEGARQVEGMVADASRLPLADGLATRVVCTEVLEHVADPDAVMAELVRVGRPGALYLLSVPGAVSEHLQKPIAPPSYFEPPNHVRIFEPEAFTRLVEDAGLVIEQRSAYGFYWAMWWMFFWPAGIALGQGSHPLLDAWNRTWSELMRTPDGARVKQVLDGLVPKVNAVVARKPA